MQTPIYSFWIEGPLKPINLLTIRSFKKHGHELIIYSYDTNITDECEVRDARLILPEESIYYYTNMCGGNPNFKFGGFAEMLKAHMLYLLGGWHVDLDVTCLHNFDDIEAEYVFRPHPKGIVANVIKAPAFSEFAVQYMALTKSITPDNLDWEKSFRGLQPIAENLGLLNYKVPANVLGMDSDEYWKALVIAPNVTPMQTHAIHWCAAMALQPHPDSYLAKLYREYEIQI